MAQQKIHLRRFAQPSSLRRTVQVRLIPQVSQALHLEFLAAPSVSRIMTEQLNAEY